MHCQDCGFAATAASWPFGCPLCESPFVGFTPNPLFASFTPNPLFASYAPELASDGWLEGDGNAATSGNEPGRGRRAARDLAHGPP